MDISIQGILTMEDEIVIIASQNMSNTSGHQVYENQVDNDEDKNREESMDENDENQIDSEGDEDLPCPEETCEFRFSSKRVLQFHLTFHKENSQNEVRSTEGKTCEKPSENIVDLPSQNQELVQTAKHKCNLCGKIYDKLTNCELHMKAEHNISLGNQDISILVNIGVQNVDGKTAEIIQKSSEKSPQKATSYVPHKQIQIKDFAKKILQEVPNTDEPKKKKKIRREQPSMEKDLKHKKRSYHCEMCNKDFGSDFALCYHMKSSCPKTEIIRKDLSAIQPLSNLRKNPKNR